jgi:hypothetical protein
MNRRDFLRRTGIFLAGARALWNVAPARASTPYLVAAAGDVAKRTSPSKMQVKTQRLVQSMAPDAALVLGYCQYPDGALSEYLASYDPTWGQFKSITHPATGDHDWRLSLQGFYAYWGLAQSYYSFDAGGWHFICLDSNPSADPSPGSVQCQWLQADVDAAVLPIIAYWARPRFSSGAKHGSDATVQPFWEVIYASGKCKLILNGHEHLYERFTKMAPDGVDETNGIRQITVGTGGAGLAGLSSTSVNGSVYRNNTAHGVLKLLLDPSGYEWKWINTRSRILDSGTETF